MHHKTFDLNGATPATQALDFSWLLDAPAGKHGFLQAKGDQLHFEDGTPIRFWGTNLTAGGNFPTKEAAVLVADRLAKSGVNLLRIHYADGYQVLGQPVAMGASLIDYSKGDSRHLNPEALDRLDYLIFLLKERGIYMHIDLLVARNFLPGDNLDYPDDLATGGWIKEINVFNQRLIDLQKEFATLYLTHTNPYTGLNYVDDPTIVVVQVMNENSLLWCRPKGIPSYMNELTERWNGWLLKHYGSRDALDHAWTNENGIRCLLPDEDPEQSSVLRPTLNDKWNKVENDWKTNYAGLDSPVRRSDFIEFLMELQGQFCSEMREHLLNLGVKCLINISNHAIGAADMLATNPHEDIVENNAYWNHPSGSVKAPCSIPRYEMHSNDPRFPTKHYPNLIDRLSWSRAQDKPHLVTEWNEIYTTDLSSEGMLMMAAYGSLQGWNGMLLYSYNRDTTVESLNENTINGFFNAKNDPSTWGQMGICSAIFQLGWVKAAERMVDLCYTREDAKALPTTWKQPFGFIPFVSRVGVRFVDSTYEGDADLALASGNTPTGDYTSARHAVVYARSPYATMNCKEKVRASYLASHENRDTVHVIDNADEIDKDLKVLGHTLDRSMKGWGLWAEHQGLINDEALISDTDEIAYNFGQGTFVLNTPYVSGFAGKITTPLTLGPLTLELTNAKMTAILAPLDRNPLEKSGHLLLSLVGASGNTMTAWDGDALLDYGSAPVWIDQATGTLHLPTQTQAVYALNPDGSRRSNLNVTDQQVVIGGGKGTINYEIVLE